MNWNIAELLPEEANCRKNSYAVVAAYISAIYNRLNGKERNTTVAPTNQTTLGLSHESDIEHIKELLSTEISQTLFQ